MITREYSLTQINFGFLNFSKIQDRSLCNLFACIFPDMASDDLQLIHILSLTADKKDIFYSEY